MVTPQSPTLMKLHSICCITVFATMATAGQALAQDLTGTYLRIEPGISVKGAYDGSNFSFIQSGLARFDGFEAFCIEPKQGITIGDVVDYGVSFTASTTELTESISKLVGNFYASGMSANEAAATQWAIWEVVLDGAGGSLLTGEAQVQNSGIAGLANSYIDQLPNMPVADVTFLSNPQRQDMVSLNAIPEPATLGLFALAGLLLFRRTR